MYDEYAGREGDIVTGIVQQTDSRYTLLDLGKVEALLPQAEQIAYERYDHGARVKAYIVEVRKTTKGPQIVVSRTHPGLVKRLFELEVPEIASGIVEIKALAREPGHRTKIAVWSNDHNVDPVGACVGARGSRVRMVTNELKSERVDVVPFSEDPVDFIQSALQPARVREVRLDEEGNATVIVNDAQLSLAIGKEGQNARLAARLTGWRIDIRSESQDAEEAEIEYAEGEWVEEDGQMVWHPAHDPTRSPRRAEARDAAEPAPTPKRRPTPRPHRLPRARRTRRGRAPRGRRARRVERRSDGASDATDGALDGVDDDGRGGRAGVGSRRRGSGLAATAPNARAIRGMWESKRSRRSARHGERRGTVAEEDPCLRAREGARADQQGGARPRACPSASG